MFTYDWWTLLSYVNIGKIHTYLHEHIVLLSYINHVWILCELRRNYPPGENSQICALFQLWLDGTCRWGLLQLEGRPRQGMLGLSRAWVFSATGWNLSQRSAVAKRVPRSTLRQGIRLSGSWAFFPGLKPHVICKVYAVAAHNHVTYSMKSTLGCIQLLICMPKCSS
jgi:hypothetical protein